MKLNKSYLTNLTAFMVMALSFAFQGNAATLLFSVGMFALSGALTNTLAIHMLFEKVPFLYGSGVIVLKFEAFKASIAAMIMREFFTLEHIEKFATIEASKGIDLAPVLEQTSLKPAFNKLVEMIMGSSFGGMLGMFGGEKVLQQFEIPFEEKMREAVLEISQSEAFGRLLAQHALPKESAQGWLEKIEAMVLARLNELTPNMVKELIEKIIHEHLGWLVVWGGIFGGLIGLIAALFSL